MNENCEGIFLSHASEDKEGIVEPLIECLKKGGISNVWYDKNEIEEGHSIIRKINDGLSRSKIGILIITPNFINKEFTNWELECLLFLTIYNKIRLIPLRKYLNNDIILAKYPLMSTLLIKEIGDNCDESMINHIRTYLEKGTSIIDHPNNEIDSDQHRNEFKETTESRSITETLKANISDIDESTLSQIFREVQEDSPLRNVNITKIRTLASNRRIWTHKVSWELIKYFVFSQKEEDIEHGFYILGEMVKVARLDGKDYVLRNVEELFIFKLIEQSDPLNKKRISHVALDTLDNILDSYNFFRFCVSVLIKAMEDIVNDQDYFNYIQFFHSKIKNHADKKNITFLISSLEDLIKSSKEDYARTRASEFEEVIIQDYTNLL